MRAVTCRTWTPLGMKGEGKATEFAVSVALPDSIPTNALTTTPIDPATKLLSTTVTNNPVAGGTGVTLPLRYKTIQELFELDYGRMNATLGTELPLTNFNTQTTKLVVCVPELGHLVPSAAGEIEDVAGQNERPVSVQEPFERRLPNLSFVRGEQNEVWSAIADL